MDYDPHPVRVSDIREEDPYGGKRVNLMGHLGTANSRMKDFYDLYLLAETPVFHRNHLAKAIRATFKRRLTPIPETAPAAFTPEFVNESKKKQWTAFLGKNGIHGAPALGEITAHLAEFLMRGMDGLRLDLSTHRVKRKACSWVNPNRRRILPG